LTQKDFDGVLKDTLSNVTTYNKLGLNKAWLNMKMISDTMLKFGCNFEDNLERCLNVGLHVFDPRYLYTVTWNEESAQNKTESLKYDDTSEWVYETSYGLKHLVVTRIPKGKAEFHYTKAAKKDVDDCASSTESNLEKRVYNLYT
jgi:hypothetical protein